jgi:bis(5'-nucleosidyl)-tetraphosphatase
MTTKRLDQSQREPKAAAKRRSRVGLPIVPEKSAGALVFHRGDQMEFLLILSTYWEFPKGLVEADEVEAEAAVREVREETGLDVKLLPGFREEITYFYRRDGRLIRKQVVYFLGEAGSQAVRVSWEHKEAKWLPYAEALSELKYENGRSLLKKANDFLNERRVNENSRG